MYNRSYLESRFVLDVPKRNYLRFIIKIFVPVDLSDEVFTTIFCYFRRINEGVLYLPLDLDDTERTASETEKRRE